MIPTRLKNWSVIVHTKPVTCVSCARQIPAGEEYYTNHFDIYQKNPLAESLEYDLEQRLLETALGKGVCLELCEECQAPYHSPYQWLMCTLGLRKQPKIKMLRLVEGRAAQ